jgi:hypothetical protein
MPKVVINILVAVLVLALLIGGAFFAIRSGPVGELPTVDPLDAINTTLPPPSKNDRDMDAVALYGMALQRMIGNFPPEWAKYRQPLAGQKLPQTVHYWITDNEATLMLTRMATQLPDHVFELERGSANEIYALRRAQDMRRLARVFEMRARLATETEDFETFADSVVAIEQIGRHLRQVPIVALAVQGCACQIVAQRLLPEPYAWSGLTAEDRAAYRELVAPCFAADPPVLPAIEHEPQLAKWACAQQPPTGLTGLLAPPERIAGELDVLFEPALKLARQPLAERHAPGNGLHDTVAAAARQSAGWTQPARRQALPTYRGAVTLLNLAAEVYALQQGNATVLAVFAYRDREGDLPDTLTPLPEDLVTDPFAGEPFRYEAEGGSFRLYSLGLDQDDDHGTHESNFGYRGPEQAPDGDYVFWPPQWAGSPTDA